MGYENITYEVSEGIATISVARPERLNALSSGTFHELEQAVATAVADEAVGAILLTGAGEKAFVAGADIVEMQEMTPAQAREYSELGQRVMAGIENAPKPVVAAVNGFALGGGCELAMSCHIRYASDRALLGQPEVALGLMPGFAGTQRLPRLVGKGRALELLLAGDPIKASEAERIGLVDRVVEGDKLLEEARRLCSRILSRGPVAVRFCLEAVRRGREMPLSEGSAFESSLFGLIFSSEDAREGMGAFVEKREAKFQGR